MVKRTKTKAQVKTDKKIWSFFMIAFPTVLIIGIMMMTPSAWWVTIILAFYQFILLKQFLDTYYEFVD